jgi:NAD(P)H dehydrogenase (quinone)
MNILIVLAHPQPGSFNHAIAGAAQETLRGLGHEVVLHDLYGEAFPPVLPPDEIPENAPVAGPAAQHGREVVAADGLVFIHPNWWGQPPAILKGWLDRVLRPGVAYRFESSPTGEGRPVGLLKARGALVFTTANTPAEIEQRVFGDPLHLIWEKVVLPFCGVRAFHREAFTGVIASTPAQRRAWLDSVRHLAAAWFPADAA